MGDLNSDCAESLSPVSLPSGEPFENHLLNITLTDLSSVLGDLKSDCAESLLPVSAPGGLPFQDHL